MSRRMFHALSWSWGIILTLIGAIAVGILMMFGKKPKKWGECYYIEVGKGWGGVNLGAFFLTSENPSEHTKNHEHGHGFQNCILGPFMLIICLMSVARYWYRAFREAKGLGNKTGYDDIWFEGDATRRGTETLKKWSEL